MGKPLAVIWKLEILSEALIHHAHFRFPNNKSEFVVSYLCISCSQCLLFVNMDEQIHETNKCK